LQNIDKLEQDLLLDQKEKEKKEYEEEVQVEDQGDFYLYHKLMKRLE